MALSKIQARSVNLTDNYTFSGGLNSTGTFAATGTNTSTNNWVLVDKQKSNGTSTADGNQIVANFSSNYNVQFFSLRVNNISSNGIFHIYCPFFKSDGTQLTMYGQLSGQNVNNVTNTPFTGQDVWPRFAYTHANVGIAVFQGFVYNSYPGSSDSYKASVRVQSNWVYSGIGPAWASGTLYANSTTNIGKLGINIDLSSGTDTSHTWECTTWGIPNA
jgi:hypothetical protein